MFGSSVEPDLLDTMNSVCVRSTLCSNVFDLRGIGGIEHVQLGKPGDLAERRLQHLGAEARAAHAEQQHVGEAGAPRDLRDAA